MKQKVCYKCQEIKPIECFEGLVGYNDDCESCSLFDYRIMIAYKRELTGDLKAYPYF